MRGKILDSQFNPGYDSWVVKQTKYGIFDGHCYFQEEDKDIENSIDGCRICEYRADSKAYKEKAKRLRERAVGARIMFNNLRASLTEEEFQEVGEKLLRQVIYLETEAKKARDYYDRRKDYEPIFIKNLLQKRREIQKLINKD